MKQTVRIFIFRRDLRIIDNIGLTTLSDIDSSIPILPIFIFNPLQIDAEKNPYFNRNCVQFMIESLHELHSHCQDLTCFYGNDIDVLNTILKYVSIDMIGWNSDFTPFSKKRDEEIQVWCQSKHIPFSISQDYTLLDIGTILTKPGKPYEVFTPFYKKCLSKLEEIQSKHHMSSKKQILFTSLKKYIPNSIKWNDIDKFYGSIHIQIKYRGGRSNALDILQKISLKQFKNYDSERNYPSMDKTTGLSPYLKFGCISIREAFYVIKKTHGLQHGLIRELIWREFYANITYYYPNILKRQVHTHEQNESYQKKYTTMKWDFSDMYFTAWCEGKTGYPIVDASMREMNTTGWMHNRCRMIVAMFLTKDLLIDWRYGERYFAQTLIDYDPSSNNGGWQWSSSTGTDAQPYFRIFSPTLQSQRFDKDAIYIRRWIPELKHIPTKDILSWETSHVKYPQVQYPKPIVSHKDQSKKAILMFKRYN